MSEQKPALNRTPKPAATPEIAATMSQAQASIDTSQTGTPRGATGAAETPLPKNFGRYKIERELGKGAMGVVYLAEDTQLGRKVALKIPKRSSLEDPEALERFYREAKTTSLLRHANICPVFDVGAIDGTHYLTMAYIPGKPVSSFIKGKLPSPKQVALLIRKIALALEEAHRQGVVHRDLKPSNVMLDDRGEPIVMDFGLARNTNTAEGARLTQSGAILGTPAYMAPEQVRGDNDEIGPKSDIYALGVMLYQFLTGELPYSGPIMMVFAQIISSQPKKPSDVRPDVDPALEAICLKMMAKDAGERYGSMKEVAAALTDYVKKAPATNAVSTATVVTTAPVAAPPEAEPEPNLEHLSAFPDLKVEERTPRATQPGKSRRFPPLWLIAGGLGGVLLLSLLGVIFAVNTGEGTVIIDVADPDVRVSFQNHVITIDDPLTEPLTLRAKNHTLTVDGPSFSGQVSSFTVKRGEERRYTVKLVDGNPQLVETPAAPVDPSLPQTEEAAEQAARLLTDTSPPAEGDAANNGWTDLLPQAELAANSRWIRNENGSLIGIANGRKHIRSRLLLPVAPTGSYEVEIRFQLVSIPHDELLALNLPVGNREVTFACLPQRPKISGLGRIQGRVRKEQSKSDATIHEEFTLNVDQVYQLTASVSVAGDQGDILISLDGAPWVSWKGPIEDLSRAKGWLETKENALGFEVGLFQNQPGLATLIVSAIRYRDLVGGRQVAPQIFPAGAVYKGTWKYYPAGADVSDQVRNGVWTVTKRDGEKFESEFRVENPVERWINKGTVAERGSGNGTLAVTEILEIAKNNLPVTGFRLVTEITEGGKKIVAAGHYDSGNRSVFEATLSNPEILTAAAAGPWPIGGPRDWETRLSGQSDLFYDFSDPKQLDDFVVEQGAWEIRDGVLIGKDKTQFNLRLKQRLTGDFSVAWEQTVEEAPEFKLTSNDEVNAGVWVGQESGGADHYWCGVFMNHGPPVPPGVPSGVNECCLLARWTPNPGNWALGSVRNDEILTRGQRLDLKQTQKFRMDVRYRDGKTRVHVEGEGWKLDNGKVFDIAPNFIHLRGLHARVKFDNLRLWSNSLAEPPASDEEIQKIRKETESAGGIKNVFRGGDQWRFTTTKPKKGTAWTEPGFDDGAWRTARGPFGIGWHGTPYIVVGRFKAPTEWKTKDIWLRKEIDVPADIATNRVKWHFFHDEDLQIHVNGKLLLGRRGWARHYEKVVEEPGRTMLKPGRNVVAVHCYNSDGPGCVDVGVSWEKPDASAATPPSTNTDGFVYAINGNEPMRWNFAKSSGHNRGPTRNGVWQTGATEMDPASPKQFGFIKPGNELTCNKISDDIYTEQKYGDVHVELEFMLPQGSNSGVFLMGEYEINLFDGEQSGHVLTGPLPLVKARKPAGEWQTLDIIFHAPKFDAAGKKLNPAKFESVYLNGKAIHHDVILLDVTKDPSLLTGKESATGPLLLQGSIGPVAYRNIRITPLPTPTPEVAAAAELESGFTPLFNGKDFTGWEGDQSLWKIGDGVLASRPATLTRNAYLKTAQDYADFELRLQFRMMNEGNSGVQFRSQWNEEGQPLGHQAELGFLRPKSGEAQNHTGNIYGERLGGWVVEVNEEHRQKINQRYRHRDWNDLTIRCLGSREVVELNGLVTADVQSGDFPKSGKIGLQLHRAFPEIEFRNIRIKELNASATDSPAAPTAESEPTIKPGQLPTSLQKDIDTARATYKTKCDGHREKLLKDFETQIARIRNDKTGKSEQRLALVEAVKMEQETFQKTGHIPFSAAMRKPAMDYIKSLQDEYKKVWNAYERGISYHVKQKNDSAAVTLKSERENVPLVVGKWSCAGGKFTWILYSDFVANRFADRNDAEPKFWNWDPKGIMITNFNLDAPKGGWKDHCKIHWNGQTFEASNQKGGKYNGTRID